ncbi:ubiquitin-conjugating enzyme E2 [Streptomyces sp. SYSU K217416]
MSTVKRISQELREFAQEPPPGWSAEPREGNYFSWRCQVAGPNGSPYKDGLFGLDLVMPQNFPFKGPTATFTTPIYHMNVSQAGEVVVSTLKDEWSPALTLRKVMLRISALLSDPTPDDAARPDLAELLRTDSAAYEAKAREWTARYAMDGKAGAR